MVSIGAALAAVVLAFGVLLAIPARLAIRVERTDTVRAGVRLHWLFGLVNVDSGARKSGRRPARAESPQDAARRFRPARRRHRPAVVLATLRTRGLPRRVTRLLGDTLERVRCETFHLRAEFGLDDPADTGRLYGAIAPLLLTAAAQGWNVDCQPSFVHPCLRGSCAATFRVRPIALVALVVVFLLSPEVLRAVRVWRSAR